MSLKSECSGVSQTKNLGFVFYQTPSAAQRSKQGFAGEHVHQNMEIMFTDLDFSELCLARRDSLSNNNLEEKGGEEEGGRNSV